MKKRSGKLNEPAVVSQFEMATDSTPNPASRLHVPAGSANSPSAKFVCRLCVPLRWWRGAKARTVVEEFRSLPLRIRAILVEPHHRSGARLESPYPSGYGRVNPCAEYMYRDACTEHMRELSLENDWLSLLDQKIAAESFRRGATWGIRSACNAQRSEERSIPFSWPSSPTSSSAIGKRTASGGQLKLDHYQTGQRLTRMFSDARRGAWPAYCAMPSSLDW